MNYPLIWFVKVTGWPVSLFFLRKKVYFEDKKIQSNKINGKALIVSNHKALRDFPLMMYTFFNRNLRVLASEALYSKNKLFSWFLNNIGGIKVDRDIYDMSFIEKAVNALNKNKVVLIYPEARLPLEEEKHLDLIEFKPSFVYIALQSGAPIIPTYTNGEYDNGNLKVIIGTPINARELYKEDKTEKENVDFITNYVKNKILDLKSILESK